MMREKPKSMPHNLINAAMLVVVAGLGFSQAQASFLTGNDLMEWCDSEATVDWCSAYVMGVADVTDQKILNETGDGCFPQNASGDQVRKVVTKWMDDNPQYLHMGADILVHNAIVEGFTCEGANLWVLD